MQHSSPMHVANTEAAVRGINWHDQDALALRGDNQIGAELFPICVFFCFC